MNYDLIFIPAIMYAPRVDYNMCLSQLHDNDNVNFQHVEIDWTFGHDNRINNC